MKSKTWALILGAVLLAAAALSIPLFLPGKAAGSAEIWSDNRLIKTVDLKIDQQFTITYQDGYNVITVEGGKIAVTEASCPDHYCMHRGFCNSGAQIVCLPNRLIIKFVEKNEIDGAIG